jgi:hypothetical protein
MVFGASVFTPGDAPAHSVRANVLFFADASCALPGPGHTNSDLIAKSGASNWRPTQGYTQVPAAAQSARLWFSVAAFDAAPAEVLIDNVFAYEGSTCAATTGVVCLNQNRFRVDVQWTAAPLGSGFGTLRSFDAGAGDSAHASFFAPTNVEVVVKVLDGCSYNDRFWVFVAGLTDVLVKLRIRDTHTGETWQYENPAGTPFPPVQDIGAFSTCS